MNANKRELSHHPSEINDYVCRSLTNLDIWGRTSQWRSRANRSIDGRWQPCSSSRHGHSTRTPRESPKSN